MIVLVQNAKFSLFLERKFNCLIWVKDKLKVMLKAKKHCNRLAAYIQTSRIKFTPLSKGSAESPGASATSTCPSTLNKFVVPEAATDSEIRWCLRNVLSSYSFRSCDGLDDLFRSMFSDSTIAEKFWLTERQMCIFF